MATGGAKQDNKGQSLTTGSDFLVESNKDNRGQSFINGSDFLFEFYCELCKDNGLNAEANGYCRNCKEYLCNGCIRAHKQTRLTREHDVMTQAAMPKDTPISEQRDVMLVKNDGNTHATHFVDINVKAKGDNGKRGITGSVVLTDTLLVITDYRNNKVKLVDTKANKLKSELNVSGQPFDVAKINDKLVAVSIQFGGKILIIKVTNTLRLERDISVSRDCCGLASSSGKLLVTFYDSTRLDIMDLQGNVIKKLEKNEDGQNIFEAPSHLWLSADGASVYVSDWEGAKKVLRLTFDGEIKSVYDTEFYPEKGCTDHCGNVYIPSGGENSVHMLMSDCVKIKELLTEAEGLDRWVSSVSHCASTNRLYVGMDSNVVKVYQLS